MPYLTRSQIEAIAQRVVAAYWKLPIHQGEKDTAVDPELLTKELLGLSVQYHCLSPSGYIQGLTAFGEVEIPIYDDSERAASFLLDGKTILIEKELVENTAKIGRCHFTIAHEASHQIYKMLYPKAYQSEVHCRTVHYYADFYERSPDDWEEWRTNALAAAILMPADLLQLNMADFGFSEKLSMLRRGTREFESFLQLAERMKVSVQALAIRMKQLGFLGAYYLGNPLDFLTAVVDDEWR